MIELHTAHGKPMESEWIVTEYFYFISILINCDMTLVSPTILIINAMAD